MAFDSFYDGYLICVLNWGLGHATRCIPIIQKLLDENKRVIIASDGSALALLRQEFPNVTSYELPSYNVNYTQKPNQLGHLIKQVPKFAIARYKEHEVIEDLFLKERIGFIISDNRYGCWHKECKNYIISHQLKPILTGWYSYFSFGVELLMMGLLSDFDEIWIPDDEKIKLSGELSNLNIEDKKYIGVISRMKNIAIPEKFVYDVIFILSGPEPQREILEKIILDQVKDLKNLNCLLVKGVVGIIKEEKINPTFTVINWLDSEYLQDAINKSNYIVCRSGYSSIMDLAILGKKAMLIPTPGQSEQEYLAQKMMDEKKFYVCKQEEINLKINIPEIEKYSGINPTLDCSSLTIFNKIFQIQESIIN